MKNTDENQCKIKIIYKDKADIWNKLGDFLITFIINTDIKEFTAIGDFKNDN